MSGLSPLQIKMRRLGADTIREDGRLERTCEHGIGHTVGHMKGKKFLAENARWVWVHGCDGCCSKHGYAKEGA